MQVTLLVTIIIIIIFNSISISSHSRSCCRCWSSSSVHVYLESETKIINKIDACVQGPEIHYSCQICPYNCSIKTLVALNEDLLLGSSLNGFILK